MLVSGTTTCPQVAEGVIQAIDLVSRTVAVLMNQAYLIFDVPPDCEMRLNGERVKLRLMQPGDRVNITFRRKGGILTALSLKVMTHRSGTKFDPNEPSHLPNCGITRPHPIDHSQ